jgi:hypothetical protein
VVVRHTDRAAYEEFGKLYYNLSDFHVAKLDEETQEKVVRDVADIYVPVIYR